MKTSEQIDQLATALAAAQGEYGPVLKNKTNPHFKNKYADLSSIFEATRPALSKNGLCLVQSPMFIDGRVVVVTRLIHKSGQWLETELSLKANQDTPQAVGSAVTYGKRYSAQAILGVDAEEDDDGEAAMGKNKDIGKDESKSYIPKPRVVHEEPHKIENNNHPEIYDMNDKFSKKWLMSNAKLLCPEISADKLGEINKVLHGLDMKEAVSALEKEIGIDLLEKTF